MPVCFVINPKWVCQGRECENVCAEKQSSEFQFRPLRSIALIIWSLTIWSNLELTFQISIRFLGMVVLQKREAPGGSFYLIQSRTIPDTEIYGARSIAVLSNPRYSTTFGWPQTKKNELSNLFGHWSVFCRWWGFFNRDLMFVLCACFFVLGFLSSLLCSNWA